MTILGIALACDIICLSSSTLADATFTLGDGGPAGTYTAADAMRFRPG